MRAAVLFVALAACHASPQLPPVVSNRAPVRPGAGSDAGGDLGIDLGRDPRADLANAPQADAGLAAAPPGVAATLARLEQFSREMCGCPDRDCADRVLDDMTLWAQGLASAGAANPIVSGAEDAQARDAAARVSRCMAEVYRRRAGSGAGP